MKKKGFTLIELLAVIVILSIIALVASAIILGVINEAKKKASEATANGFIDAVDYNNNLAALSQEGYTMITDGEYELTDPLIANIKMRGKNPNSGEVVIENRRVSSGCLQIGEYKVSIESGKVKTSEKGICNEQVTIHFDSNGGSSVADQTRSSGKKIGVLPESERNNYGLVGWFTEKNGGSQINADTVVTGETTYYAHWEKNAVSVTFDSQGGSAVNSITVSPGESIGTLPNSTKNGYLLKGWYTASSGGTKVNGSETLNDDVTYYAIWGNKPSIDTDDVYTSAGVKQLGLKGVAYINPIDLTVECTEENSQIGTGAANESGCMRFYIFDDSGDNYKMILDHNTTALIAYDPSGTYKEYSQASIKNKVDVDTAGWVGNPRIITANEIKSITNTNPGNFFHPEVSSGVSGNAARSKYAWLLDYTSGCTSYGCSINDSSTLGYWTSSGNGNIAWGVLSYGKLDDWNVGTTTRCGIRPVIEVAKSNFAS